LSFLLGRTIIQEFFKNQYSIDQRFAMLDALGLGARELASLWLPPQAVQPVSSARTAFPSRMLPEGLHQRYITGNDQRSQQVRHLLTGITREAIERGKEASADKVPELVRERRLRIRQPPKVTEIAHPQVLDALSVIPPSKHKTTFTEVATECFLAPLINHFWLFLRDEQTREERTAQLDRLHRYRGAGTALILNPMVLAQFLTTLAVLVHAAQNAPEWLAVVAPDALELAVTLGTRPVSLSEEGDDDDDDDGREADTSAEKHKGREAAVLSTALEVALVVLDGCLEVDGGRSIGLEHTALVLATGEWADTVLTRLEKGVRVAGGGGAQEVRLRRAAAGVLIKVEELSSRWRRSMIDVR
jgi:telomere length regulation protein